MASEKKELKTQGNSNRPRIEELLDEKRDKSRLRKKPENSVDRVKRLQKLEATRAISEARYKKERKKEKESDIAETMETIRTAIQEESGTSDVTEAN